MANTRILGLGLFLLIGGTGNVWAQESKAMAAPIGSASTLTATDGTTGPDRPVLQQRNPRYRIQRDDILTLSFSLSPELNQTVTVQPDGYVSLQNAGSLYVQGMTLPEVIDAFKKVYAKVLHDPIIDVDLKDFQKPFFVVLGQVGKPGQYDLRYDMTVTEAIAVAGGFAPTAKTQVFLYHRSADGWVEAKELKLKDILNGKNINEDASMRPGDMIFVPEKTIAKVRKYIPYGIGTNVPLSPGYY